MLAELPNVLQLGLLLPETWGGYVVEIFAGCCGLTWALVGIGLDVLTPWDLLYGEEYDVVTHGWLLVRLAQLGAIAYAHLAVPCQSLTLARRPALRDHAYPRGRPGLTPEQNHLVAAGNALVDFACVLAFALWTSNSYFSIENPWRSWLWAIPEMKRLFSLLGVGFVAFSMSDHGAPWYKPTVMVHNLPTFHQLGAARLSTDGRWRGLVLKGAIIWRGQRVNATRLAMAYPPALCEMMAAVVSEAVHARALCVESGCAVSMAETGDQVELHDPVSWPTPAPERECDDLPADMSSPFVNFCPACPKGLSCAEHIQYAFAQDHPLDLQHLKLEEDLADAIAASIDVEALQGARAKGMEFWSMRSEALREVRRAEFETVDADIAPLVRRFNVPVIRELIAATGHTDSSLPDDLLCGFPLVGRLPRSGARAVACEPGEFDSLETLRRDRRAKNLDVIAAIRPSEFDCDVWENTLKDVTAGLMSDLRPLQESDLDNYTLTRRLPVRETRSTAEGQVERTRVVDHATESGLNPATAPTERVMHDTLDVLLLMLRQMLTLGVQPRMWKQDVRKAFRCVPIAPEHQEFSWVVFGIQGRLWIARHLGCPFGATASVHNWHRVGALVVTVARRLFLVPAARYTDDFFGCDAVTVAPGARAHEILKFVALLVGLELEPEKEVVSLTRLPVLGGLVTVDFESLSVWVEVSPEKRVFWMQCLRELSESGVLDAGSASKLAGRLSFSVTVVGNAVGRAFIRPFHAQAHKPLPGSAVSPWLRFAAAWFHEYLQMGPKLFWEAHQLQRRHLYMYTDAAGESRGLAAVLLGAGRPLLVMARTSQAVWDQLLPRGDHQIGIQELLAVLLGLYSLEDYLGDCMLSLYVDNDGVLGALLHGAGNAPETNIIVGRMWLWVAQQGIALWTFRVESAANVADAPSRGELDVLYDILGERPLIREPVWPEWLDDLWTPGE